MGKRFNIFGDSQKLGDKGEALIRKYLEGFLHRFELKSISFKEKPNLQMKGIDGLLKNEESKIECKTRSGKEVFGIWNRQGFKDILVELRTGSKEGWFYTCSADSIAYVIFNKQETDLQEGYLISIQDKALRQFVLINLEKYPTVYAVSKDERDGHEWVTRNVAIPIRDFPDGTVISFIFPEVEMFGDNRRLDRWT